jgi:hypothetical protein
MHDGLQDHVNLSLGTHGGRYLTFSRRIELQEARSTLREERGLATGNAGQTRPVTKRASDFMERIAVRFGRDKLS